MQFRFKKLIDPAKLNDELMAQAKLMGPSVPQPDGSMRTIASFTLSYNPDTQDITIGVPDELVEQRKITAADFQNVLNGHVPPAPLTPRKDLYKTSVDALAASPDLKALLKVLIDNSTL